MILTQFQTVGRDLFLSGLVSPNGGNLSIRLGERIIITRRECRLGDLQEQDLIETGLCKNDRYTPLAPQELCVHRRIYETTPALAIVHAHPPHAIALSLTQTEIVPNCEEELNQVGHVPVLGWNIDLNAAKLADIVPEALIQNRVAMIHGHGSFAIGQLLDEAHNLTTALEESCKIICLLKSLGAAPVKKSS